MPICSKKKERMYETYCLDDYDEELCYDFVEREDDSEWDDGESDEERYQYRRCCGSLRFL